MRVGLRFGLGPLRFYVPLTSGRRRGSRKKPVQNRTPRPVRQLPPPIPVGPTPTQIARDEAVSGARAEIRAALSRDETQVRFPPGGGRAVTEADRELLEYRYTRAVWSLHLPDHNGRIAQQVQSLMRADLIDFEKRITAYTPIAEFFEHRVAGLNREAVAGAIVREFGTEFRVTVEAVDDDQVTLVVGVPSLREAPVRAPATTPTGLETVRALSQMERAEIQSAMVARRVVAVAHRVFAVSPSTNRAHIAGVDGRDYIIAVSFDRPDLEGAELQQPWEVVDRSGSDVIYRLGGRARALLPIDPGSSPAIARALDGSPVQADVPPDAPQLDVDVTSLARKIEALLRRPVLPENARFEAHGESFLPLAPLWRPVLPKDVRFEARGEPPIPDASAEPVDVALKWLQFLGDKDTVRVEDEHSLLHAFSNRLFARVHLGVCDAPTVKRLVKGGDGRLTVIFSTVGFTPAAVRKANDHRVALVQMDLEKGTLTAASKPGANMLRLDSDRRASSWATERLTSRPSP